MNKTMTIYCENCGVEIGESQTMKEITLVDQLMQNQLRRIRSILTKLGSG